ncbi:hypothetical protein PTSG_05897 [Salpingoeca rosetta]|uniref:Micro-fibrillar-associated protein 1 C-terminal domain-containing protein n=1 Tax=Salpingoeca rosetta (strain ATCC 50818 / BSB-021) TaxID=946362 RepID=F2UD38_SALR5|nr:uncharacterized protein PTSG_05897 [Salpingoeca rosetta]EGD74533.1 hypothetical protein PTSG_05897 [Salpingoeca rosetta]|eukprot:XP_004992790.1 hypothetical protein PTSG_05897 [Salpingoeca rosetta]
MSSKVSATAGAIPIKNEKGEIVMQKVKVQRYKAGMRPSYARDDDDDEYDSDEVFVSDRRTKKKQTTSQPLTMDLDREVKTSDDRRLQRLRQAHVPTDRAARLARLRQREAESDDEGQEGVQHRRPAVAEVVEEESESESEDEDAIAARRARLLARARERAKEVEEETDLLDEEVASSRPAVQRLRMKPTAEVVGSSDDEDEDTERQARRPRAGSGGGGDDDESDEESSEYESYTESESEDDTRPIFKPVFVKKDKRLTKLEEEERFAREEERLEALQIQQEEQRKELRGFIESTVQQEMQEELEASQINFVDDDDETANKEEEFEHWKLRELKRIKRFEVERVHAMTEEEREEYFKANPKLVTNKADKGKMGFMQKYYHKGAFFQDEDSELFKRDVTAPTLEDKFDKTVLPKVMQVKNFGRMGRTKYTHLADQDTTDRSAPWFQDKKLVEKTMAKLGGHKQDFDRPAAKKKKL